MKKHTIYLGIDYATPGNYSGGVEGEVLGTDMGDVLVQIPHEAGGHLAGKVLRVPPMQTSNRLRLVANR